MFKFLTQPLTPIKEGDIFLIIVKAKPPKKSGKDIVYETKELYNKIKGKKKENKKNES